MILLNILGVLLGIILVGIGGLKIIANFAEYIALILSLTLWSGILSAGIWLITTCLS